MLKHVMENPEHTPRPPENRDLPKQAKSLARVIDEIQLKDAIEKLTQREKDE